MTIKSIFKIITQLLFDHRQKAIVHVSIEAIQPNSILKGRTALITGGTSGIGLSIAMAYAKSGASVIITGRDGVRLSSAVQKLKTQNNDATICSVEWDATKVSSFEDKFKTLCEVLNQKGVAPIDILVNNAGVNCKGMPNATEAEYDKVLDTNLKGVFFLSQMIGKYWVSNGIRGNILNIASASSLRPADSAYILSKWGLRGLTLGLAKSLAKHGITVVSSHFGPYCVRRFFYISLSRIINFGQYEHKRRRQVLCLNGSQIPNRVQQQGSSRILS